MRISWHKPLLVSAAIMFLLAAVALGGLVLDHRTLLGAPLWLKPGKFGIAFGAYALTLAWLLSRLEKAKRLGWWAGTVFAVCGVLDVAVIAYAAASGTFSHFNTSSDPVNRLVQSVFEFAVPPILVAIRAASVGYTGIFVLSFWQAWRGQSVLHPDARTLIGLAAVAAVTGLLLGLQQVRQVRQRRDADVGVEAAQRGDRAAGRLARVDAGL